MFAKFIETYGAGTDVKNIPPGDLDGFRDVLPAELLELVALGEGSYMNGFLWIVNPAEYRQLVNEIYLPVSHPSICFARDAFGCLYLWEDNSVVYIDINYSKQEVVGRKLNVFFDLKLTDNSFLEKKTSYKKYLDVKSKLGPVSIDECYGYITLLGLGGFDKPENSNKVKLKEYLSIVAQALGKIQ